MIGHLSSKFPAMHQLYISLQSRDTLLTPFEIQIASGSSNISEKDINHHRYSSNIFVFVRERSYPPSNILCLAYLSCYNVLRRCRAACCVQIRTCCKIVPVYGRTRPSLDRPRPVQLLRFSTPGTAGPVIHPSMSRLLDGRARTRDGWQP